MKGEPWSPVQTVFCFVFVWGGYLWLSVNVSRCSYEWVTRSKSLFHQLEAEGDFLCLCVCSGAACAPEAQKDFSLTLQTQAPCTAPTTATSVRTQKVTPVTLTKVVLFSVFICLYVFFSLSLQMSGWVWRAGSGVCLSLVCPAHVPGVLWASPLLLTWRTEQETSSLCGTLTLWLFLSFSTDIQAHRTRHENFTGTQFWNDLFKLQLDSCSLCLCLF